MAELFGKVSEDTPSLERREDLLTSNVFQSFRYLKPSLGIIPFLNSVLEDNKIQIDLDPDVDWTVDYFFWPIGSIRKREPDLLISLKSEVLNYAFVVEAKYLSGPSDKETDEENEEKEFGNQLSDQFIDLKQRNYKYRGTIISLDVRLENCFLLYLTADNSRPKTVLELAMEQFKKNFPNSEVDINSHLLWTNWTKVWTVLKKTKIDEFPYHLIRNDLISLLERKGFKEFTGFSIEEWGIKYNSFYQEIWFDFDSRHFNWRKARFYYELWYQVFKNYSLSKFKGESNFFKEGNNE